MPHARRLAAHQPGRLTDHVLDRATLDRDRLRLEPPPDLVPMQPRRAVAVQRLARVLAQIAQPVARIARAVRQSRDEQREQRKCGKRYPKEFLPATMVMDGGYPLYRRRSTEMGGFTVTKLAK